MVIQNDRRDRDNPVWNVHDEMRRDNLEKMPRWFMGKPDYNL